MRTKPTFVPAPEHARVPKALPTFLLEPDRPPRYRWWQRLLDQWSGIRDRMPAAQHSEPPNPVADSPWLQRLLAECAASIAVGRTRTDGLVAILDKERATLRSEAAAVEQEYDTLRKALDEAEGTPVDDGVHGAGEQYSTAAERLQRRQRRKSEEIARLRSRMDAAAERLRLVKQAIGVLEQERRSHWSVLQERARVLTEHYQRRAASYTRGLERRRRRVYFTTPTVSAPDWVHADLGSGGDASPPSPVILPST